MIEQGSPEWIAQRIGKATGSRVADIIATTKSGPAASRANYAAELVAERLTGQPAEHYQNGAMLWGKEKEPEARAAYEFMRDATVDLAGFVDHPTIRMSGASPDGYIGGSGLIEIKCPITATHIETLLSQKVPSKYITQMMWQMACTGTHWCDYVSFDPRMPARLQLFITRIERDEAVIVGLEKEVAAFLREIDDTIAKLERVTA